MFFDMHADVWTDNLWEYEKGKNDVIRRKYKDKFIKGGLFGGIFVIYMDAFNTPDVEEVFFRSLRAMSEELYHSRDLVHVIKDYEDFEKAEKQNKFGVILGIEGLPGIGSNLDYLYLLERTGVRHIGMTWNEENAFATGQRGDVNRGLTDLGIKAVEIIENLGILLDVSHANDKTFWDIAKYSKKPFFASHSNARSLCPSMRNLTDEQILCIGERNGMIGMNSYHGFVSKNEKEKNLDMLLNHMEYIAEKIGLDKVGFGFDFAEYYSTPEDEDEGLQGVHDVTEIGNVKKALEKRGYSKEEIENIAYKNFVSFFERVRGK
ncbi:dipeptidase [Pseudoleptotrichia goodfellowii]|uniref:Peptidase M19 n=1 Tax=Pseudoleptotrichia goodfellowii TaxID=157692 RepID=A0A510JEV7_9FUSO|nr:membrane dipeptidase [Pseudoleptotrichia goodfellowii]MBF4806125.1 membrane dipeptidase [Pseudoleptotrichia goodfellowii]BBM36765.1 peptidase M19 [Pseudoleptotrichia goodfellowii]